MDVWYDKQGSGGQGLIIDKTMGETIAVAYKGENAPLIAAAPDLLKACKDYISGIELCLEMLAEGPVRDFIIGHNSSKVCVAIKDAIVKAGGDV